MSSDRHHIKTITVLVAAAFLVVLVRLWQLQVIQGRDLRQASENNHLRITPIMAPRGIIYDRNGTPLVKNSPEFGISVIPEMIKSANVNGIAALLGMDPADVARKLKAGAGSLDPVKLKEGLTYPELARIESRLSDFPELTVDVDIVRDYIYGDVAAHLIGYIGKINDRQVKEPAYKDVPKNGFVGQWGIEKLYDQQLRGVTGQRIIEVDALGRELKVLGDVPPKKGRDLTLALDLNIQLAAEKQFGDRTGAFVAINPNTGELLALMSKPAFDPNKFVMGISRKDWQDLMQGDAHPMLDRAFQSQYPPGSTFKIITAMAALESGSVTPDQKFTCTGGYPMGGHVFHCWRHKGHGPINIYKAIVESCDVYFYNAGLRTGIDRIAQFARAFGLGKPVGIRLGSEKSGLIPDTAWKEKARHQKWYPGETLNASIGQGYVLVTPLQMARMMGAVGTGGRYLPDLHFLKQQPNTRPDVQPISLHVSSSTMDLVRSALAGVVNDVGGTAHASKSALVAYSGKTGTAQASSGLHSADHAWFVAYAPSDNPQIAMSVLVEKGGHGASAAVPVARKAIEAYIEETRPKPPVITARNAGMVNGAVFSRGIVSNGAAQNRMVNGPIANR
ncbi:MAG: penicillin-binding protein 2 [Nitrospiraceae bacterium]|nr:penicillin-binding protein 2 [Nitrospiraceae bacterium]